MAASFMKKTMAYLGLVDDDYDDYDDYESRSPAPVGRAGQRSAGSAGRGRRADDGHARARGSAP